MLEGKPLSFFRAFPRAREFANAASCLHGFVVKRIQAFVSLSGGGFEGLGFWTDP